MKRFVMVLCAILMAGATTATVAEAGQKLPFPAWETWWVSQGNQSNSQDDTHRTGSTMEFAWDFNYPGGADLGCFTNLELFHN